MTRRTGTGSSSDDDDAADDDLHPFNLEEAIEEACDTAADGSSGDQQSRGIPCRVDYYVCLSATFQVPILLFTAFHTGMLCFYTRDIALADTVDHVLIIIRRFTAFFRRIASFDHLS